MFYDKFFLDNFMLSSVHVYYGTSTSFPGLFVVKHVVYVRSYLSYGLSYVRSYLSYKKTGNLFKRSIVVYNDHDLLF